MSTFPGVTFQLILHAMHRIHIKYNYIYANHIYANYMGALYIWEDSGGSRSVPDTLSQDEISSQSAPGICNVVDGIDR